MDSIYHLDYLLCENMLVHFKLRALSELKFVFSRKATEIDEIFTVNLTLTNVKSTVKISSIIMALLENMNFILANSASKTRLVGSENDLNGIYFHHHFYLKTGVKSM